MNAPPRGAPKPPPELWAAMEAAGAAGDETALNIARSRYRAWLEDHGVHEGTHGAETPPEAYR